MSHSLGQSRIISVGQTVAQSPEQIPVVNLRSTYRSVSSMRLSWLENIPPERVGLHGEYDHAGLAKRVKLLLCQQFGDTVADQWHISQRGKVVIFVGPIAHTQQVSQLMELGLSVDGAEFVEIHDLNQRRSDAA